MDRYLTSDSSPNDNAPFLGLTGYVLPLSPLIRGLVMPRPIRFGLSLVIVVAGLIALLASPALADSAQPPSGSFARPGPVFFEGRAIDLKKGWCVAQSCVVFPDQHAECFRTNAQANRAIGETPAGSAATSATAAASAVFDCANRWLCLYGSQGGTGRRLLFGDEYWHHLDDWNFADMTKSWRNNQTFCSDTGILGDGVGGSLTLPGCARSAQLNSYWSYSAVDVHG